MCLENKKMIILRFVLFFGIMLLLLGCVGIRDDDPNVRYRGIVSEPDCSRKNGYWYNNECWSNVTEHDHNITLHEVEAFAERYIQAKEFSKLYIGGIEYQILEVATIPIMKYEARDNSGVMMTIKFLMEDGMEYNLVTFLDESTIENEKVKNVMTPMLLYESDAYYDFSSDYSEIPASMTAYKELIVAFIEDSGGLLLLGGVMGSLNRTEDKDMDILIMTLNGTLEMFVGDETPILFDVRVSLDEMVINGGNSTLSIEGDTAYLNGTLGAEAYVQIRDLQKHPEVKILVLQQVPGSILDEINLHTGRLVHMLELITYLPSDGEIYSGGVDIFAAGVERIVERGGELGIHAWCCVNGVPANKLVDTHPLHRFHIEYLTEVMGEEFGPSFYFRTIKAAPADDMYIMIEDEMIQSGIATRIIDPSAF